MRDFPSCFGENGVQVSDASCSVVSGNKTSQNSVTCIYKCKIFSKSCLVTIIWSKNLMGQCLSVEIDDDASHKCLCKVDVKPSLFSKRKGSKCLEINTSKKIEVFWDLSLAKFGSGPEPLDGYYISIVFNKEMVLLVGDLKKEAFKKTGAVASLYGSALVSKKEHISGKGVYGTKTQFCSNGRIHDVKIECDVSWNDDPCLVVRVDSKPVMQIKHLHWKFRGNYTISVDGLPVEVFWDVRNWLFGSNLGNAVFLFRSSLSPEKTWGGQSVCDLTPVLSWSCSGSFREGADLPGLDFYLFLYAWRNE
ncbi:hypothetical protein OROGR_008813 [Orobanche gracilis]